MTRPCVSWLLPIAVLASSFAALPQQETSPTTSSHVIYVATAEAEIEGIYVLPIKGAPFTAKIKGSVVSEANLLTAPPLAVDEPQGFSPLYGNIEYNEAWPGRRFIRVIARNAAGEIYYDDRNAVPRQLLQTPETSQIDIGLPRPFVYTVSSAAFYIIDPKNHTRTVCLPSTKTCSIEALPRYSPRGPLSDGKLPRATETTMTSLGTKNKDGLNVEGRLETTTLAARAFGNPKPLVDQREVWHSEQMGLDVFCKRKDSRKQMVATAEVKEIVQKQPDPRYFEIPADYTVFDDRAELSK